MAKFTADVVLDAALNHIATSTLYVVCAGQPIDRADALARALAQVVTDGTDFTLAAGDTSGRKVTVGAQSGLTVDTSGTADHVALCDGTTLLQVTTVTAQALTAGNTADLAAYDVEFADVTP